jgi:nicotinamidase/pyrazinamidase
VKIMERLYVDVDTQWDFCDPAGALAVRGAPAALEGCRALIRRAVLSRSLLVGSVDTHDFTAWELVANGGPFPPHCIKGTRGWLKIEGTLPERAVWIPNVACEVQIPEDATAVLFEKEVYSLFANPLAEPILDRLLARRGLSRSDVEAVVFGVATDYCVKAAALGLRERGFAVTVIEDAIAGVAADTERAALAEMRAAGCRFARVGDLA